MPEVPPQPETSLKSFQEEIQVWIDTVAKATADPHAAEIDVGDLTEDDMEIWKKLKDKTLVWSDIKAYKKSLIKEIEHADLKVKKSRYGFQAVFADKASVFMLNKARGKE